MGKGKRQKLLKVAVSMMQRVTPTACPRCTSVLDAATGISTRAARVTPAPGKLTLCSDCGTWLAFTDDMGLRLASEAEINDVDPAARAFARRLCDMYDALRAKH